MSTLIIAKNTTSAGTDTIMQTSVTLLRAFTMCGTISPFYCCDNSFIKSFVNVNCPNTMCLGIIFSTESFSVTWKKWLSITSIHVHLPSPQYSLWRTNKFILLKFDRVAYICEQMQNSSQHVFEICIVQHVHTENVHLLFRRKLSANHNQAYTSSCHKRQKKPFILGIIVSTSYWLLQSFENSVPVSICTPSIYSQARWLSWSPTMLLSDLQTLDHIQLFWL